MSPTEAKAAALPPAATRAHVRTAETDTGAVQNLACQGDSRWFAQLLGGQGGNAQGDAGDAAVLSGLAGLEAGAVDALVEQLAARLHDAMEAPLQALLHLPQLGRVSVSARRLCGEGWDISLQAEDEGGQAWLAACQVLCKGRLADALSQPVALRVIQDEAPA